MFRFVSKWWNEIDKVNFFIIIAMATIGVILSFSINKDSSLFNKHILHSVSAIVLMIVVSNYKSNYAQKVIIFLSCLSSIIESKTYKFLSHFSDELKTEFIFTL